MECTFNESDCNERALVWVNDVINNTEDSEYNKKLNDYRNTIDKIDSLRWKRIRWYINHYDFIVKDPIINRAFFKFWETNEQYNLVTSNTKSILALAEAPGGFIQAINFYMKKHSIKLNIQQTEPSIHQDNNDGFQVVKKKSKSKPVYPPIYTISLNKNHERYRKYNLPTYNTQTLTSNVHTYNGVDDSGDLCNLETAAELEKLMQTKVDLITADGGFDEGDDFNNKEQLHYNLITYEIYYCLRFQKEGGVCMIKFFDMFTDVTMQLVYILAKYYTQVYIYKPLTSRPTNSEKYLVCKGFKGIEPDELDKFTQYLLHTTPTTTTNLVRVPKEFEQEFIEKTTYFVKAQCKALECALHITEDTYNKTCDKIKRTKSEKYQEWKTSFNFQLF